MTSKRPAAWRRLLAAGAASLLALVACGGGDLGSGGTGAPVIGLAVGTVNGFGSVVVDGVVFDDRSAPPLAETEPGEYSATEVRLGERVEVEFEQPGVAKTLRVEPSLIGPIANIDAPGRFVVLGQQVIVNTDPAAGPVTQLDGYQGAADLAAGDVVEVHGVLVPQGTAWAIQATRIERQGGLPAYLKLSGVVSELGVGGSSVFKLGGLTVDAGAASVLPAGRVLANGQVVVVMGPASMLGEPVFVAAQVRLRTLPAEADEAYVSGAITGLDTTTRRFMIGDLTIDYAAAVLSPAGAQLADGLYVRVQGAPRADGVLAAASVTVRDGQSQAEAELKGSVTAFNPATMTFAVRDVVVDASNAQIEGCPAGGLADGLFVEVHGSLSSSGVVAEELHCGDAPSGGTIEREGVAGSVDLAARTFVLTHDGRSQLVSWNDQTFFRNVTPQTLAGKELGVEGVMSGSTLNASKIKFDD